MSIVAMGANFRTMPLDVLERMSVPEELLAERLSTVVSHKGVSGAVILSTCNRVELYVDARTDREGKEACDDFFAPWLGDGENSTSSGIYLERGEDVARHLFYVVCSLDSQVLGEAQILGQVKEAYRISEENGTSSEVLAKLFKDALHLGKRARSETCIGNDSVSLSTTAFKTAAREFDDISDCQVLFVGAGEMARLALAYLQESGVSDFLVTSRTHEHAQTFAQMCGALVFDFEDRYDAVAKADIVFTMTSTSEPVICAAELEAAREKAGSTGRKLVIIDEAVPRDVEEACAAIEGVMLYNLETLGQFIDEGLARRMAAVGQVEILIAEAEKSYLTWMQQRNVVPTIREIYAKGSAIVSDETAQAIKALSSVRGDEIGEDERQVLEAFGNAIMKKILHGPTARLRLESETADSYYYTGAARYLFGLDTFPPGTSPHTEHCTTSHPGSDASSCTPTDGSGE